MTNPKASKQRIVYRSASTGRIVKVSTAKRWPAKTFAQKVGPKKPRRHK